MADVQELAKKALKLNRKYSKATMSMVLAQFIEGANAFGVGKLMQEGLDRQKDTKMSHLKDIAEGRV